MSTALYPKRLIEVDLPIKRISEHARREKNTHQGHISTLHIWWARRPLAACRAAICAALWPDPADPLCPGGFRKVAARVMQSFAERAVSSKDLGNCCSAISFGRWTAMVKGNLALDPTDPNHLNVLRYALLDFIADFANWDNSTRSEYLVAARALTQAAHETLGGAPGTRPLVVDPFAGGGSIPLEALRVGADAFASDLNPVAVIINKVLLDYAPRYGQRLPDELRRWGRWVKDRAAADLCGFYPTHEDGASPLVYFWARTVQCEGPSCGFTIPLLRSTQLTGNASSWGYSVFETSDREIQVSVMEQGGSSRPTVSGGSVTCPRGSCGFTTPAKAVRAQLASRHGGAGDAVLLAVYVQGEGKRIFRTPSVGDIRAIERARLSSKNLPLPFDEINPIRPHKNTRGLSAVTRIGANTFSDLYTARQSLAILGFERAIRDSFQAMQVSDISVAVATLLEFALSRMILQNSSLSRWDSTRMSVQSAFGKQALQVVWDFVEINPFSDGPANWQGAVEWVAKAVESNLDLGASGTAVQSPAQSSVLPDSTCQAVVTDPPYFAAIPYADLSNFFYTWERPFIKTFYPDLYSPGLVDQRDEIVVTDANVGRNGAKKDAAYFRVELGRALAAARRELVPQGIGVVIFADSRTESWEAVLQAVIEAGWSVTGSWPIDTEMQNRTQASGAASLQSSIHVVCRPRYGSRIGDWRDVLSELPGRIHEWMPRLAQEGVVGADAIFACLGPALEIFSRYERVEKASGEQVSLGEYLEHVWAAVAREAMSVIFREADATGFEPDARLTAMWLWTVAAGAAAAAKDVAADEEEDAAVEEDDETPRKKAPEKGFALEFDAARKIAQGLGANLERLTSLVQIRGDSACLLPVAERVSFLFKRGDAAGAGRALERKARRGAQMGLFGEPESRASAPQPVAPGELAAPEPGETVLDRLHQAMLLFGRGRGDALRRFLIDDGAGSDERVWRLAQALSALYPTGTDEKRWVDGVLARKKGFGF